MYQRRKRRYSSLLHVGTLWYHQPGQSSFTCGVSAHLLPHFAFLKLFCMKNSNLFLCCTPVALAGSPALWKDLTPCQSHQDLTHQDVPCAERDPTLCWAMTAARGTITEIGGDDKAAGLGDLQGASLPTLPQPRWIFDQQLADFSCSFQGREVVNGTQLEELLDRWWDQVATDTRPKNSKI